jgi:hypothetical protein
VPPLSQLKRLAQDENPYASSWQKLGNACNEFDALLEGPCHGCGCADPTTAFPVYVSRMVQRSVDERHNGLVMTPFAARLRVAPAEELWEVVAYPLRLCDRCRRAFYWSRLCRASALAAVGVVAAIGLIALFVVARLISAVLVVIVLTGVLRYVGPKGRLDRRLDPWLQRVPIVWDAMSQESELQVRLGKRIDLRTPSERD